MNTTFPNIIAAQNAADRVHADMCNPVKAGYNADYVSSVALYASSGGTKGTARWAVPYQDLDINGNPIDTKWHVTVDERCRKAVLKTDKATIPEWANDQGAT